jgi:predicted HNH restriction endonuclease
MTFNDHMKFRTTKVWKDFREKLLLERGAECTMCGTKYSGKRIRQLQVHHRDPEHYEDLTPEKFCLLCSGCHRIVERLSKKIRGKNGVKNKEKWLALIEDYLPYS